MIKKYIHAEIIIMALLLMLIFSCSIPGMSESIYKILHIVTTVVFALFAFFLFKKTSEDEREEKNRAMASELSFLVGGAFILGIIIQQSLQGIGIDNYLFMILLVMILSRLFFRIYFDKTK